MGSSCTHGGYVYDGRFVDGNPLLYGYPVGHGLYDGHRVFSDGINFNGQNLIIGGTSYGAHGVSYGGYLYDGYQVDGVNVVYGHPGNYFSSRILSKRKRRGTDGDKCSDGGCANDEGDPCPDGGCANDEGDPCPDGGCRRRKRDVSFQHPVSSAGLLGHGIVYGGRQLVNSIVFNGRSIVIDGTVYDGTHCTHNGYVYDARYVGGFPTVFGYPVGY